MKHSTDHQPSLTTVCNSLIFIISLIISSGFSAAEPATLTSQDEAAYELVRLDWEEQIPAGTTLVLDNRWGDIRLRQSGDRMALFHAVMQKIGAQPKVAELMVERTDRRIAVKVVYPEDGQPASPREGRVDAALLVPEGVNIEIIAEHGEVSSKKMNNHIKVQAVDQAVSLESAAAVAINTNNGDVSVQFVPRTDQLDSRDRGRIQTIRGDINVRYYPDMPMRFEMLSGRPKTTNDLELLRNRELTGRQVNMHTGKHPQKLYLQSDTGYIRLINTGSEILRTTAK